MAQKKKSPFLLKYLCLTFTYFRSHGQILYILDKYFLSRRFKICWHTLYNECYLSRQSSPLQNFDIPFALYYYNFFFWNKTNLDRMSSVFSLFFVTLFFWNFVFEFYWKRKIEEISITSYKMKQKFYKKLPYIIIRLYNMPKKN